MGYIPLTPPARCPIEKLVWERRHLPKDESSNRKPQNRRGMGKQAAHVESSPGKCCHQVGKSYPNHCQAFKKFNEMITSKKKEDREKMVKISGGETRAQKKSGERK